MAKRKRHKLDSVDGFLSTTYKNACLQVKHSKQIDPLRTWLGGICDSKLSILIEEPEEALSPKLRLEIVDPDQHFLVQIAQLLADTVSEMPRDKLLKRQYRLRIGRREKVYEVLREIGPYLNYPRRRQLCDCAMALIECLEQPAQPYQTDQSIEQLVLRIRALNKHGRIAQRARWENPTVEHFSIFTKDQLSRPIL